MISTKAGYTCGPARMASGDRASTLWPASTRACAGWGSTTSTSSTATASIPTRRWKRPWGRSTSSSAADALSTPASRPTIPSRLAEAAAILRELGTPCLIHQPRYNMFDRWIEDGLLDVLEGEGVGCIPFSPLAQGLLTDRYLDGIPTDSRAGKPHGFLRTEQVDDKTLKKVRQLDELAAGRDQSLAQMALAWVLKDHRVTTVLIGASSVNQLEQNLACLAGASFSTTELSQIDSILST